MLPAGFVNPSAGDTTSRLLYSPSFDECSCSSTLSRGVKPSSQSSSMGDQNRSITDTSSANNNQGSVVEETEQRRPSNTMHPDGGAEENYYTDLGIRNLAALFVSLSDDVKRQKKKMQKHSIRLFHFMISRKIEKRKTEAFLLWRAACLSLTPSPDSAKPPSSALLNNNRVSNEGSNNKIKNNKIKSGKTDAVAAELTSASPLPPTLHHLNLVVESLNMKREKLNLLLDR